MEQLVSVWIFALGEDHEGYNIEGVYSSEAAAIAAGEEWVSYTPNHENWKRVSDHEWQRGCDYLIIERHEVQQ